MPRRLASILRTVVAALIALVLVAGLDAESIQVDLSGGARPTYAYAGSLSRVEPAQAVRLNLPFRDPALRSQVDDVVRHFDEFGAPQTVGRARAFQFGDFPEGVLGSTDEFGNITIQRGLTGRVFEETLRHETVHSVLTLPAPLNRLTVGLYGKSGLYRYAEEALAEGYATGSLHRGLRFPVSEGYVSIPRLASEAGAVGAAGYGAYEWAR